MSAPLKVLLVGNYREDAQRSMLGFGNVLEAGLHALGVEPSFIAPQKVLRSPARRFDKWFGYADKYILFPRTLRRVSRQVDVVHLLDQGNGIYVNHLQRKAHVVTCHDLLAIRSALGELPYWATGPTGKLYQKAILSGLRRASHVACVSGATYNDAARLLQLSPEQLSIIHNGLYAAWSPRRGEVTPVAYQSENVANDSYALHVGNDLLYKNRKGAIALFRALKAAGGPSRLVCAGKPLARQEWEYLTSLELQNEIIEAPNPTGADLEWLYGNAWGLLVTSFDEGFGLPIIEAQACGCPVVIPAKEPMLEVAGGAAIPVDLADLPCAAKKIVNSMKDVHSLQASGYNNVRRFSSEAMIAAYAALYQGLNARFST